jgi:4'-phosphopantetheinyl transferase EntD
MNDRKLTRMLRFVGGSAAACALVCPAAAAASEPLVWTEFADPDPNFVAPPEPRAPARPKKSRARAKADAKDQAAYEAGRSLAEAAIALEAAACQAIKEGRIPPERAAMWAKSCAP